jgi:DNA-binding response OmpR family regulator
MSGHVLLVDDDDDVRRVLRVLLVNAGFAVSEIPDGRLAVAEAARLQPDLILIDWVMPELDGCAATALLKRNAATAEIPVVMLSAKANAADKIDALAAGVSDFLDKPFRSADIVAKVQRFVDLRRAAAAAEAASPNAAPRVPLERDDLTGRGGAAAARKDYAGAATAYSLAAEAASAAGNAGEANECLRLAGQMHQLQAEASTDPARMHDGYRAAARFFLAAGERSLANQANAAAKAALARVKPL